MHQEHHITNSAAAALAILLYRGRHLRTQPFYVTDEMATGMDLKLVTARDERRSGWLFWVE